MHSKLAAVLLCASSALAACPDNTQELGDSCYRATGYADGVSAMSMCDQPGESVLTAQDEDLFRSVMALLLPSGGGNGNGVGGGVNPGRFFWAGIPSTTPGECMASWTRSKTLVSVNCVETYAAICQVSKGPQVPTLCSWCLQVVLTRAAGSSAQLVGINNDGCEVTVGSNTGCGGTPPANFQVADLPDGTQIATMPPMALYNALYVKSFALGDALQVFKPDGSSADYVVTAADMAAHGSNPSAKLAAGCSFNNVFWPFSYQKFFANANTSHDLCK